jgi:phage protein D
MSELRQPRSIVAINGGQMPFVSWETNNNGYYQADTFTVRLPLNKAQVAWWSETAVMDVIIYDATNVKDPQNFSIANLSQRLQGAVDTIEVDPIQHSVRITGRDYTSKLIDTKVAPPSRNVTASDVAKSYAATYGLTSNVTRTTAKIGTYYDFDHVSMKVEKSAWDILCYLAHQEQFIVYVSGKTLNFIPLPPESAARVLTLDDSQRIVNGPSPTLCFSRTLTMARGIIVHVRSWNDKNKKGFTKTAIMHHLKDPVLKKNSPAIGQEQVYTYVIPNLTPVEAQAKADAYLDQISRHEVRFSVDDMPGDPTLDPFQPVKWTYNGNRFAQVYYLESIIRSFDFENGYKMSLRGKNHSVESVVLA